MPTSAPFPPTLTQSPAPATCNFLPCTRSLARGHHVATRCPVGLGISADRPEGRRKWRRQAMGSCGRLPRRGMSLRLELCLGEDAIEKTRVGMESSGEAGAAPGS